MHINAHLVETAAHTPAVSLHIDNMPEGGVPAADSITTAMLKAGCVNADKVAAESVGEGNLKADAVTTAKIKDGSVTKNKLAADVLPKAATKATPGIVKQAARVADCAASDANGCKASINAVIKALVDAGIMAVS